MLWKYFQPSINSGKILKVLKEIVKLPGRQKAIINKIYYNAII